MRRLVEAISGMHETGFGGVQIHAAHGGLLNGFLSPYSNHREEAFGGTHTKRVNIMEKIMSGGEKVLFRFRL